MTIEDKANEIAAHMVKNGEDKNIVSSPMLIIAIISILIELFKLWKSCNKTPKDALQEIHRPGIIVRWMVRRTVRKVLDDEEMEKKYAAKIAQAIMSVKVNDEEEMVELFSQV